MKAQRKANMVSLRGEVPGEFRIWPYGLIQTSKYPAFQFDRAAADQMVAAAQAWGNDFAIDYEHRFADPVDNGPVPAAGWFNLEARDDGLWAVNVRWTARAAEMLAAREYRYVSPFWNHDTETNRPTDLINLALTNVPATFADSGSGALVRASRKENDMLEQLRKMLGLPETATEEEVMAALSAQRSRLASAEAVVRAAGIQADLETDEARGQAIALAASAQLAPTVAQLQTRIAELEAGMAESTAEAIVEEALSQNKMLASQRGYWLEKAKGDPKGVKAYFASAAPVVPASLPTPASNGQRTETLSETELQVIAQTGVSKDAYLATKQRLASRREE